MYINRRLNFMEQFMKIDRKYLTFSIVILLSLVIAGLIQLSPPETPESSPQFYFRNSFLSNDLICEKAFTGPAEAKYWLIDYFIFMKRRDEAAFWQASMENVK